MSSSSMQLESTPKQAPDYKYAFKFVMIGDSGVGKSCLLLRFTDRTYHGLHDVTLGVEFKAKNVIVDGCPVKLQIWDTAGQENFKSLTRSYYRGACCALLVYDVTKRDTFVHARHWAEEVKRWGSPHVVIMLVGNKVDLGDRRVVSAEEGQDLANELGSIFLEVSAKTADNVELAFVDTARKLYEKITNGTIDPRSKANGVQIAFRVQKVSSWKLFDSCC